jgi:hypothetical protein
MPELAILEQTVLTGLIEKYVAPPDHVATRIFQRRSHPYTVAEWDVIQGTRYVAHPTMPNREGKIVGQAGVGKKTASFIYVREKKAFEPTTLRWLREPGNLAQNNAEACVRRETQDLNNRLERLVELYCWQTLKGTITINEPDVKATVSMGIPALHTPTVGANWSVAATNILADIAAWKVLVANDCGMAASDVYVNTTVMGYLWANTAIKTWFTDKHKEEYFRTGSISGLAGLNWHAIDLGYMGDNDVFVPYLADTELIMLAQNAPETFVLLEGLSADEDAPRNHTGKFSKTWETKDPSGRFVLLEYNFIPVLLQPEAVIYADLTA